MHRFPENIPAVTPENFTDPFRYTPHPLVRMAAEAVMKMADEAQEDFSEGKMLGTLVVSDSEGKLGYLAGFSGVIGGKSTIERFVPPIFDLMAPNGDFKKREAEISEINTRIQALESSPELSALKHELSQAEHQRDEEIGRMKAEMALSKIRREGIRSETEDASLMEALIKESQFQKAELRRTKAKWENIIDTIRNRIKEFTSATDAMKKKRAAMSVELQKWIFSRYIVSNALGERKSIKDIFSESGLTPPGGTGECAAPKLLYYAYEHGLKPLAMGEFWYGRSPRTAVRTHGRFYPSCTSKCGPLLSFMLRGLELNKENYETTDIPVILYADEYLVVVEKPSGMPSVPGLDGRESLQEWLSATFKEEVFHVHRLDMDTSGVIIYARTTETATDLQRQFENHTIKKIYKARLSHPDQCSRILVQGEKGSITLPLSADYDERPRQKADFMQGKEALTEYEVDHIDTMGTTDIIFKPQTGRTHQLRVHSAHALGLGRPIAGDLLYGGDPAPRLALHAYSITFMHPASHKELTFRSNRLIY